MANRSHSVWILRARKQDTLEKNGYTFVVPIESAHRLYRGAAVLGASIARARIYGQS